MSTMSTDPYLDARSAFVEPSSKRRSAGSARAVVGRNDNADIQVHLAKAAPTRYRSGLSSRTLRAGLSSRKP
jgi:hypothetical protein